MSEQSAVSGQQSANDARTLAESGFYWRERDGVKVLCCRPLEDAGFLNGFSTRLGGVSVFSRKTPRIRLCRRDAFTLAILTFTRRKHTLDKPRRSRDGLADAINFNNVDAY